MYHKTSSETIKFYRECHKYKGAAIRSLACCEQKGKDKSSGLTLETKSHINVRGDMKPLSLAPN